MSTPPVAVPLEPGSQLSQPGLSEPARIINTFVAPSKTFEDLKRNASWWVPWLLTTIFGLIFSAIAVQKLDMVRFTREQIEQSKMAQRQMEQLSPEQRENAIQTRARITKVFFFITPVFGLILGLILAAILMGVFNFGFAAEVPFMRALAIVFYSFLPRIVVAILLGISLMVSSDPNSVNIAGNPMPTNPAFFMDPQGNKFLYGLLSGVDVFALWVTVLLGLGFSVASGNRKLKPSTAITTMLVLYGLLVLVGAGFKAMF
jgi:Yip1 domain